MAILQRLLPRCTVLTRAVVVGFVAFCFAVQPADAAEDRSGQNLSNQDWSGRMLVGDNFSDADLSGSKFDNADLSNADLRGATLSSTMFRDTNFSGANLSGQNFSRYVNVRGSKFNGANLSRTKGWRDITACSFAGADVRGANFLDSEMFDPLPSFRGAKYDAGTRFPKGLDPADIGAILVEADDAAAPGLDISGQKFVGRDMRTMVLRRANATDTDLTNANLAGAQAKGADFSGAEFSGAILDGADLTGAKLHGVRFDVTMLRGTVLADADLEGVDFSKANTRGCNFRGANLRRAKGFQDITECDFSGADLRGAVMLDAKDWTEGSARYRGAKYDKSTRFPAGVDPEAVGAVLSEEPIQPRAAPEGKKTLGIGLRPEGAPAPAVVVAPAKPKSAGFDETAVGKGADLHGKDFSGRDLRAEALSGANLEETVLLSANLNESDLRLANLRGVDLMNAHLERADLTGADLREAKFERAWLSGANFSQANLSEQDLAAVNSINDTKFRGADLRGLKRLPVVFSNCDFRGADLRGANLAGPTFDSFRSSVFEGATYDKDTKWPRGFDVEGSGVVRVGPAAADTADLGAAVPKLLAVERDPDGPNEGTVKRVFREKYVGMRAAMLVSLAAKMGMGDKPVIPPPLGIRDSFEFVKLDYHDTVTLEDPDTKLKTKKFPLRVVCDIVSIGQDGSESKTRVSWSVDFVNDETLGWQCEWKGLAALERAAGQGGLESMIKGK